jgi:hypothetical protein
MLAADRALHEAESSGRKRAAVARRDDTGH